MYNITNFLFLYKKSFEEIGPLLFKNYYSTKLTASKVWFIQTDRIEHFMKRHYQNFHITNIYCVRLLLEQFAYLNLCMVSAYQRSLLTGMRPSLLYIGICAQPSTLAIVTVRVRSFMNMFVHPCYTTWIRDCSRQLNLQT